jgi:hypothetical protein
MINKDYGGYEMFKGIFTPVITVLNEHVSRWILLKNFWQRSV